MPEKALIRRIVHQMQTPGRGDDFKANNRVRKANTRSRVAGLVRGIGDDCAVVQLPAGHEALLTTDFSLEGIHFRRDWHPPESVGHRCLARGLSDIAAMGGEPVAAFLSLALPPELPQGWVDRFLKGFLALARRFTVPLAGGDTAQSSAGVLADVVVLGSVPRGQAVLRSGARPGDFLCVTGELGGAARLLSHLRSGSERKPPPRRYPAHFFPTPRLAPGRELRKRKLATAMIDISDGLSTDLHHLCEESGVGACIYADRVPAAAGKANLQFALHGGDDYELLFACRRDLGGQIGGVKVTCIGEVTRGRRVVLVDGGRRKDLPAGGWQHFGKE